MDPVDDLLRGVRADGAGVSRKELSPPWTLTFTEGLTLVTPLRGKAWLADRPVGVGDTVIGHGPFTLSDGAEHTVLLVATFQVRGEVSRRLLSVLPPALVVPGSDGCASFLEFLDTQVEGCLQGPQVSLDRLLDWLVVCNLRAWFDQPDTVLTGWFHALGDDVIGPVLRAMHAAPDRPWTLATLASEAGVSRTTLASRFTTLVGQPPLTYLTDWRMALAADLLTDSTATVAAVARRVGYADAFGFSAAFKRVHGVSPSEYRACHEPESERLGTEWAPA